MKQRHKLSLKTKLTLAYILVALVSVVLTSMLARVIIDRRFQDYVKENLGNTNTQILEAVKMSPWITSTNMECINCA